MAAGSEETEAGRTIDVATIEKLGARKATVLLIRAGLTPAEITRIRRVSLQTTFGYIDQAIGAGLLRRSDVLFTIPGDVRRCLDVADDDPENADPEILGSEDADVVDRYGGAIHSLGDMYEDLCALEVRLHEMARALLVEHFGPRESGWWRKGIPESIRTDCTRKREQDPEPAEEAYQYTDLLDLGVVIKSNWRLFRAVLPMQYQSGPKAILSDLRRLNGIRRRVMHPVRHAPPGEDDFRFTHAMKTALIRTKESSAEFEAALAHLRETLRAREGRE